MTNSEAEHNTRPVKGPLSVTVAIPCYNGEIFLHSLLEAVFKQTQVAGEVLVVDDGSQDRTKVIAKQSGVKLIEHDTNRGLACARNSAIQHAKGDIIVFFDADTVPDAKNLERMLREYSHPEVAGVGGQEFFPRTPRKIDLWRNLFWRQTHGDERINSAWMLMGLCCSYRRDALLEVGGFDEKYVTNGEDVDMGLRLSRLGYRLVYLPEVGVFHKRRDTLASMISLAYRHSFWQSRALRKNGINPFFQIRTSLKWFLVSTGSSFRRHRDMSLILLSPIISAGAIAGRVMEWWDSLNCP